MSHTLFSRSRILLAAFVTLLQLGAGNIQAQTMPVPQSLPYTQTFSSFTGTTTTYPAGWQGWVIGSNISSTLNTAAPTADQAMQSGGATNASSSAFVADMVGKMGLLSSGSNERSMCLALNTTGFTNIVVTYQAGTQEQLASSSTRVDELDLEYRVGTTGAFTAVTGGTYQNNGVGVINTGTAASNTVTIGALLPTVCNNSPTVQVRWVERDVTGSGGRPSFSITNISCAQGIVTTYYSKSTGNLDIVGSWGTNTDGTGTAPTNFTGNLHEFHIVNGNPGTITTNWTISGTASKLVVDGTNFTVPSTHTVTATIDVNAGRTLTLANAVLPTFGALDPTSTEIFSGLTGIVMPSAVFGNITFNNSTVTIPVSNSSVVFAGNFTLQGTAAFNAANTTAGYSLVTTGTANQIINSNSTTMSIWNFDVGSSNTKGSGTVTLTSGTNISVNNSMDMILSGTTNQFSDGGNTLSVINNIDLGGNASSYSFTGTLNVNSAGSGSANFRGNGTSSDPCVASFNNVNFNNTIPIQIRPGGFTLVVKGNLTVANTATALIDFDGSTLSLGGNFTYNATTDNLNMSTAGSTLSFSGTGAQTYSTAVTGGNTVTNLTMSNSSTGLTLSNPLNITGTLTLTTGVISTGVNTLYLASTGTVSGANAASYVNGNFNKVMPASTTSMVYEVGDVTFSPIQLTFSSSVSSGSITVKSTSGAHPQIAGSYINTGNMVNRYWTITNGGVTVPNVNVALSYNSGDITGGTTANTGYIMRQYSGSVWSTDPAITNTTAGASPLLANATASTGIAGASFSGDYAAGLGSCTVPVAGTAVATPPALCNSGTSSISLSGASSGNSIGYQWASSTNGTTWTPISGATVATYTTPTITATTYYQSTLTCLLTTSVTTSTSATVTVNPVPPAIFGANTVCEGLLITLSDDGAGTWTSSNTTIAVVGAGTGVVTGTGTGTAVISYSYGTGCLVTTSVVVRTSPAGITGPDSVCLGNSIALNDITGGGVWSTLDVSVATVSGTGNVTSVTAGTALISYTLISTGCASTVAVTVNPTSPLSGIATVCAGDSVQLTDIVPGGTWSSTNAAVATIDASGYLSGISAGTATITYGLPTSCYEVTLATVHAHPLIDTVTGGGSYCTLDTGIHIGLTGSTVGINYQLYNSGSTVGGATAGTGNVLDFGLQTIAGQYTVIATNATTGCASNMSDTAGISVIPVPVADTVTGGGGYCIGGTGVHVGLDSSMTGVIYQLYLGNTPVGTPDTGNGHPLDFGLQTVAGMYTVIAGNPLTACSTAMTGTVTVTVNPLPDTFNVNGGGSYCAGDSGVHVGLDSSVLGLRYQLFLGAVAAGTPIDGTGHGIDFGIFTGAGTYKAMATDTTTGCMNAMNDSAVIIINPSAVPHVQIGTGSQAGDTVCLGSVITFTAHTRNGGSTPVYQWAVNNLYVGAPDSTYPYIPTDGDVIAVKVTSDGVCVHPDTATDTIRVRTQVPVAPSVFILVHPLTSVGIGLPDTLIAVTTNCGTSPRYQWFKNGTIIAGATNDIYTAGSFVNHDSVSCRVITSGACGGVVTYNSVIITVYRAGVTQLAQAGEVRLFPNPNKGSFMVSGSLGMQNDEEVSMEITDVLGQVVYRNKVMTQNGMINEQVQLNNTVANGMYLLNLRSTSGNKVFHFVIGQ